MHISRRTFALGALASGVFLSGCGGNKDERAFRGRWKSSAWGDPMVLDISFRSQNGDRFADVTLTRLGQTHDHSLPRPVTIRDNALYTHTPFGEYAAGFSVQGRRLTYMDVEWSR